MPNQEHQKLEEELLAELIDFELESPVDLLPNGGKEIVYRSKLVLEAYDNPIYTSEVCEAGGKGTAFIVRMYYSDGSIISDAVPLVISNDADSQEHATQYSSLYEGLVNDLVGLFGKPTTVVVKEVQNIYLH